MFWYGKSCREQMAGVCALSTFEKLLGSCLAVGLFFNPLLRKEKHLKKLFTILTLFWSFFMGAAPFAKAAPKAAPMISEGTFAPGISLGLESAGALSLKYWQMEQLAFALNIEYLGRPFTVFYADVLYQFSDLLNKSPGFLRESLFYAGGGLGAGTWHRDENCVRFKCTWNPEKKGSGDGYFLRAVVGLEWYPQRMRIGVFGEAAPSYLLYPNAKLITDIVAGVRFYL